MTAEPRQIRRARQRAEGKPPARYESHDEREERKEKLQALRTMQRQLLEQKARANRERQVAEGTR